LGVRARLEDATINNSLWLDKAAMELRCPNVMQLAVDVMNEWELTHQPESEWTVMHLYNHIRKKLDIIKREGKPSRQEAKEARRADLKQKALQDLIAATNGIYQQPTERNGYNSRQ
jgi:hypothetical protein